jgi:hypothetical protein
MRRHIVGIIIAALIFFGATRSTEVYRKYYVPFSPTWDGELKHFGKFHSRTYKSWDGQLLTLYCHTLDSEQEAQDWFSERLSDATEIRERSPFLDVTGKRVGDRAEVVFPATSYRGRVSAVVLLKGVNVYVLFGESRSRVLEFEKFPDIQRHNLTTG